MKRVEVQAEYEFYPGTEIIRAPGKFEGCASYAPHFYDSTLEGFADENMGTDGVIFYVSDEDRAEFPELDDATCAVLLTESDQGFVSVEELTTSELDQVQARYAELCESDED